MYFTIYLFHSDCLFLAPTYIAHMEHIIFTYMYCILSATVPKNFDKLSLHPCQILVTCIINLIRMLLSNMERPHPVRMRYHAVLHCSQGLAHFTRVC